MDDEPRPRVVVIDDHPVIAAGLAEFAPQIEVVASFGTVDDYLRAPDSRPDVVLLDLQLDTGRTGNAHKPIMGTEAIRRLLELDKGPIVVYTAIAEDMLLAACLAAGAMGAVTKTAPSTTIAEVIRIVSQGNMWVDPTIAGALTRYAQRRHAGALSPQQANALRYRGQGLKQQAIADKIGVSDPEIVHRYLKAAVDKLADLDSREADDIGKHPGAHIDDVAQRSGLSGGLVRWEDLQTRRTRARRGRP
ncbi:MAG: response regulator transcription factor [Frankiaceae bacterium]